MSKEMKCNYSISNVANGYLIRASSYEVGKQYDDQGMYTGTDETFVFSKRDDAVNWLRDNGFPATS